MDHIEAMIESHPAASGRRNGRNDCIVACHDCAAACTACEKVLQAV